jgi:hypothetical protein
MPSAMRKKIHSNIQPRTNLMSTQSSHCACACLALVNVCVRVCMCGWVCVCGYAGVWVPCECPCKRACASVRELRYQAVEQQCIIALPCDWSGYVRSSLACSFVCAAESKKKKNDAIGRREERTQRRRRGAHRGKAKQREERTQRRQEKARRDQHVQGPNERRGEKARQGEGSAYTCWSTSWTPGKSRNAGRCPRTSHTSFQARCHSSTGPQPPASANQHIYTTAQHNTAAQHSSQHAHHAAPRVNAPNRGRKTLPCTASWPGSTCSWGCSDMSGPKRWGEKRSRSRIREWVWRCGQTKCDVKTSIMLSRPQGRDDNMTLPHRRRRGRRVVGE